MLKQCQTEKILRQCAVRGTEVTLIFVVVVIEVIPSSVTVRVNHKSDWLSVKRTVRVWIRHCSRGCAHSLPSSVHGRVRHLSIAREDG